MTTQGFVYYTDSILFWKIIFCQFFSILTTTFYHESKYRKKDNAGNPACKPLSLPSNRFHVLTQQLWSGCRLQWNDSISRNMCYELKMGGVYQIETNHSWWWWILVTYYVYYVWSEWDHAEGTFCNLSQ